MARILLTAFDAYEPWNANASWLSLIALTRDLPNFAEITTRLYPVDLDGMKAKLESDLKSNFDFAIHVGQAPRSSCIQLEEFALNVSCDQDAVAANVRRVCESGPPAYRSALPVRECAYALRQSGIPARVSFHAGTFLCNALFYWSCRLIDDLQLPTRAAFVHVPLDTSQVINLDAPTPFMPAAMTATGLRQLIEMLTQEPHASA